jgi:hypothetical protein
MMSTWFYVAIIISVIVISVEFFVLPVEAQCNSVGQVSPLNVYANIRGQAGNTTATAIARHPRATATGRDSRSGAVGGDS